MSISIPLSSSDPLTSPVDAIVSNTSAGVDMTPPAIPAIAPATRETRYEAAMLSCKTKRRGGDSER